MNDFYYEFAIDQPTMNLIRDFYWQSLHPIHLVLPTNNVYTKKRVTHFRFDHIVLSPEMEAFFQKYSMLMKDCLISDFDPGAETVIHIDGISSGLNRMCAINFPITGNSVESPIIFYGHAEDHPYHFDEVMQTTFLSSMDGVVETGRGALVDQPVLINTKSWHRGISNPNEKRISLSISCRYGIDLPTARQMLMNM